jgi:hypothetical protein
MTKVWPEGLEGVWPSDKQIEYEAQLHHDRLLREFECLQRDTEVTIVVAESATEAAILYFEEVFGAGWPGIETIRVDDMQAMGTEHFKVTREGSRTVILPNN